MDKKTELHQRFFDVQMPDWFKRASLAFRGCCAAAIAVVLALHFSRGVPEVMITVLIVIGLAVLMALPSIPKAFIEQRNRIRGLRDGTMQELIELEKDSQQDK